MTTWTKRSNPSTAVFLEGLVKFRKMSNGFYYSGGGFVGGREPSKLSSNFYDLAGSSYPGSFFTGRRVDNFIEARAR